MIDPSTLSEKDRRRTVLWTPRGGDGSVLATLCAWYGQKIWIRFPNVAEGNRIRFDEGTGIREVGVNYRELTWVEENADD